MVWIPEFRPRPAVGQISRAAPCVMQAHGRRDVVQKVRLAQNGWKWSVLALVPVIAVALFAGRARTDPQQAQSSVQGHPANLTAICDTATRFGDPETPRKPPKALYALVFGSTDEPGKYWLAYTVAPPSHDAQGFITATTYDRTVYDLTPEQQADAKPDREIVLNPAVPAYWIKLPTEYPYRLKEGTRHR